MNDNEIFESILGLAQIAADRGEVPIAAVIRKGDRIISSAHNETEHQNTFLAHAEILAIQQACHNLGTKYLNDCVLYVSIEPCLMCLSAAKLSRISSVHYLLKSEKFGESGPAYFSTQVEHAGLEAQQTRQLQLLQGFFQKKRLK